MLRCLAAEGRMLEELTVAEGIRSMIEFARVHQPQHAEIDVLESRAVALSDGYELTLTRRMRRHDHPEAKLRLTFTFDERGSVRSRSLIQS